MRRRKFIKFMGGAVVAAGDCARAANDASDRFHESQHGQTDPEPLHQALRCEHPGHQKIRSWQIVLKDS
jgi:hypothetical protein